MLSQREVRVPDIGDFKDIPVIEILVKPGDLVQVDQPVVSLESDKATLDVPTPTAGRVVSVEITQGSRVSAGSLILILAVEGASNDIAKVAAPSSDTPSVLPEAAATPSPTASSSAAPQSTPLSSRANETTSTARVYAGPAVRRLGRELGADLTQVCGSGRGGRILEKDVRNAVQEQFNGLIPSARQSSLPIIDHGQFGDVERIPLSRIRRISGSALARNWATIPHVTNFDEADVTDLENLRTALNKESGGNPKLTLLSFLIKAVCCTLRQAPGFNASLDGSDLIVKKHINIGVAVDTPGGLVVPVLRGADQLGIREIAHQLSEKAALAQAGKLRPGDFEAGSFTISSLGGVGGTGFTPIINAPEIAILGVSRAATRPVYQDHQFVPRLILPLSLSWDHRATDGLAAARFLVHLASVLQDFRRVSL